MCEESLEKRDREARCRRLLHSCRPKHNAAIIPASLAVERILQEPDIKTFDELASRMALNKRSLQRLFQEYVGVSPKWVIRRFRLHELIERLESEQPVHWPP